MLIVVNVKFNKGKKGIELNKDGTYSAYLTKKPINGSANQELIDLIAKHFKTTKDSVSIVAGKTSHIKKIKIL